MSGIVDWLSSIAEKISSLPQSIADKIKGFFDTLLDGIKRIFIPEDGFIESKVQEVQDIFGGALVGAYDMSDIFTQSEKPSDIEVGYNLGKVRVSGKIVDFSFLDKALVKIRPFIRGVIALFLILFNINQFLSLIGQNPISIAGVVAKQSEKGGKNE